MTPSSHTLWLIDQRGATEEQLEDLREDLAWFDLVGDKDHLVCADARLWEEDPIWRLPIPGRFGQSEMLGLDIFDARGGSLDTALAAIEFLKNELETGAKPKAVLVDWRSAVWLEHIAARREEEPFAMGGCFESLGYSGAADGACEAFAMEGRVERRRFERPSPAPFLLNEDWSVIFDDRLDAVAISPNLESANIPVDLAQSDLCMERFLTTESSDKIPAQSPLGTQRHRPLGQGEIPIMLPGEPGEYKVSIELTGEEWALYRLEDAGGGYLGFATAGPGLGSVIYSFPVAHPSNRPLCLMLRPIRRSKALLENSAPDPIQRIWLSKQSDNFIHREIEEVGGSGEDMSAVLKETLGMEAGKERRNETRRYRVRSDSRWLEIDIEQDRVSGPRRLAFRPSGKIDFEILSPADFPPNDAEAPADFKPISVIAFYRTPEGDIGSAENEGGARKTILWLCDCPVEIERVAATEFSIKLDALKSRHALTVTAR